MYDHNFERTEDHATLAQCLTLYFGHQGKFSMGFKVLFQVSTGKKLLGKNHGKKSQDPEICC